jgi:hypothetical protein
MKELRKNLPALALGVNIGLAILLFFLYDPFQLIKTGYVGAGALLELDQEAIKEIVFEEPAFKARLVKGQPLPDSANSETKAQEKAYEWSLVSRQGGREIYLQADKERVGELLKAIQDGRRYYGVPRNPEKDRELEMARNSKGEYDCPRLTIAYNSGKSDQIFIGRSSARAGESYVRLNDEDSIFLVENDLRAASGSGNALFFRNRRILPAAVTKDNIGALNAEFDKYTVRLQKDGGNWRMELPAQGKVKTQEISSLVDDIAGWKANSFLEKKPENMEKDKAFRLEISYNAGGNPAVLAVRVLGKMDYSSYIVEIEKPDAKKDEPRDLYEITSVYLNDLYEAESKLLERQTLPELN